MRAQEYFTALEVAETAKRIGAGSVPHTKRNVQAHIKRNDLDISPLARNRQAKRGGGREYHFSLFPDEFVTRLISHNEKERVLEERKEVMAKQQAALEGLSTAELSARQRSVMEARSAIIQAVKLQEIEAGQTRGQAVNAIVARAQTDDGLKRLANKANDRGGEGRTLSRSAVYRWLKEHKEGGLAGLAPKATKETHSFPDWFKAFMSFYARPQAPTITEAFEDFRYSLNNPADAPSYSQIRRALSKLDKREGTQARHRGREGVLAIKARHAYVLRDTSGLLPTSVYTADGKTFDAEVQHPIHGRPFRPEVTSILDVATRRCVGWSAGLAENARDVKDALRVAVMNCGIPAVFYVDNGSGFKNAMLDDDLTGMCGRLGITKMHSLPYNSQARGIIERFNATLFTPLAKKLPTYVGADMDREARQKAFKQTRRDLKEIGTSSLLLTWTEFLRIMDERVEAYNNQPHAGVEYRDEDGRKVKRSPMDAWRDAENSGFEVLGLMAHEADDLFRPTVKRRTRRGMVEWITNSYFHLDLEPYDGLDILVGFDVHDAGRVWCREIDITPEGEQPGKLICVAQFEGNKERYIPLSYEKHAMEKRHKARLSRLQNHVDEVELELNPNRFLTQSAEQPFEIGPVVTSPPAPIEAVAYDDQGIPPEPRQATADHSHVSAHKRPAFSDDASFARWCCENPDDVSEKDRALLRTLARDKSARDYLRTHEVDLTALEKLVRPAA